MVAIVKQTLRWAILSGCVVAAGSAAAWAEGGDERWAEELYRLTLGRAPDGVELQHALIEVRAAPFRVVVLNRLLDSDEFHGRVDDATFLVGLYAGLHDREPSLREMWIGRHFLEEGISRSAVLGGVLRAARQANDADADLQRLYDELLLDFSLPALRRHARVARSLTGLAPDEARARLAHEAEELGGADPGSPALPQPKTGRDSVYRVFFGYLHAHTKISLDADGGGPHWAYQYARDNSGLDFLGLSDHGEFIDLFPWDDDWDDLYDAAEAYNEDGVFVALRGFEFSNPLDGHVNVFNTSGFTSAWSEQTMREFYRWLERYPQAAATFNHPGRYDDYNDEFDHFRYFPGVGEQMIGIELLTHNDHYDQYSVGYVANDGLGYLDEANHHGWRIGSVSAQDNHNEGWGSIDDYRTGVLAPALTRADILEAIRARRFYSTQDRNLTLSFRADGREMGSVVEPGINRFVVRLGDGNGEAFRTVDLYADGRRIASRDVGDRSRLVFRPSGRERHRYYYVLVTQQDGDQAMSAPIWVRTSE